MFVHIFGNLSSISSDVGTSCPCSQLWFSHKVKKLGQCQSQTPFTNAFCIWINIRNQKFETLFFLKNFVSRKFGVQKYLGFQTILVPKKFSFQKLYVHCPNLNWPVLTCLACPIFPRPVPTWLDMFQPYLTCLKFTLFVLTRLDKSQLDFYWSLTVTTKSCYYHY